MNHHCFWINKCIGQDNRKFYFIFILFTLIYTNHTLYICFELLWDDVNLPYDEKPFHFYFLRKDRGFRVLGAASVGLFALIVGLPSWFLFMIEIFKTLGLLGKNKSDQNDLENVIKKVSQGEEVKELLELETKDSLFPEDDNLMKNSNETEKTSINENELENDSNTIN